MKITIKKPNDLSSEENNTLWNIYRKSYQVEAKDFNQKRALLDLYALYYNSKGEIIGFTGIRDKEILVGNTKYRTVYFGQTMILKDYRGKGLIQKTVIRLTLKHYLVLNRSKLIIWNDSLSYRPYLIMAKGLKNYYPNPSKPEQVELKELSDKIGNLYYPGQYSASTGVVSKAHISLNERELFLSTEDLSDPHIDYYVSRNPGYKKGDGLITLCPATFENLRHYICIRLNKILKRAYEGKVFSNRKTPDTI